MSSSRRKPDHVCGHICKAKAKCKHKCCKNLTPTSVLRDITGLLDDVCRIIWDYAAFDYQVIPYLKADPDTTLLQIDLVSLDSWQVLHRGVISIRLQTQTQRTVQVVAFRHLIYVYYYHTGLKRNVFVRFNLVSGRWGPAEMKGLFLKPDSFAISDCVAIQRDTFDLEVKDGVSFRTLKTIQLSSNQIHSLILVQTTLFVIYFGGAVDNFNAETGEKVAAWNLPILAENQYDIVTDNHRLWIINAGKEIWVSSLISQMVETKKDMTWSCTEIKVPDDGPLSYWQCGRYWPAFYKTVTEKVEPTIGFYSTYFHDAKFLRWNPETRKAETESVLKPVNDENPLILTDADVFGSVSGLLFGHVPSFIPLDFTTTK